MIDHQQSNGAPGARIDAGDAHAHHGWPIAILQLDSRSRHRSSDAGSTGSHAHSARSNPLTRSPCLLVSMIGLVFTATTRDRTALVRLQWRCLREVTC